MITRLKDTYLPLSEIRNRLDGLNTAELESLLIDAQQSNTIKPDGNAASYVARILQSYPGASRTIAEQPTAYQQVPTAPAAAPMPMINESAAKKTGHTAASDQERETAREHWQRITLSSDVELHIREPQSEEIRELIHQLIEHASMLFSEKGK
jgi:DNA-binding transcriptional MerR regulator